MTRIAFTIIGEPASSRVTYIYGLTDPETGQCRYVGKSDNPSARFKRHLEDTADTHKVRWIRQLRATGKSPGLIVFEVAPLQRWQDRERHWIAVIEATGTALTNSTAGGIGPMAPSLETRERMRIAKLGGTQTAEHRAKVSAALKGRPKPPRTAEHTAAIAAGCAGRVIPPEHRAKLSAANKASTSRNALGLKGVYFDSGRGKYQAHIKVERRKRHLGRFDTARDAAIAYNSAARQLGWPEEGLNRV